MDSATAITETGSHAAIHRWREPVICCDSVWEENYARFETPEQEIRKFIRRFRQVGSSQWSSDSRILDLFCGRGNGLKPLERLGFDRLEGVDRSERLLAPYSGPRRLYVGDAGGLKLGAGVGRFLAVPSGLH